MSLAWDVSDEDVAIVFKLHGVDASQLTDRALGLCPQANAARIERAALAYNDIDEQAAAALNEIENVLIEAGVLSCRFSFQPRRLRMGYTVVFEETTTYEVEFSHDSEIDPTDESQWFEALDTADPQWWRDNSNIVAVDERELVRLEKVEPASKTAGVSNEGI